MAGGYLALTEKEKQTLRLIVRGHDAKSTARELGLSVHTINERLRDARRKLSVSSSREAARLVLAAESWDRDSLADKRLGEADRPSSMRSGDGRTTNRRFAWTAGGVLIVSLIVTTLASNPFAIIGRSSTAASSASRETSLAETEVSQSARAWLVLVDERRWSESWNQTGQAFKNLNTSRTWALVSEQVRPPFGAVISRTLSSQEHLPAPPHGYEVVKFRTSFAAKGETTETVALIREEQKWKAVGYLIG